MDYKAFGAAVAMAKQAVEPVPLTGESLRTPMRYALESAGYLEAKNPALDLFSLQERARVARYAARRLKRLRALKRLGKFGLVLGGVGGLGAAGYGLYRGLHGRKQDADKPRKIDDEATR